ncbi:outer membrane beta-barrel domain-containing protein [Cellvibrio sp. KY-GH-1]|uniref:outer membrane beta-barrel domain-containing protein n=1 Tax=Cellvibrio sp. KY-GH-1 TaxID=2303332 RepID=UPI0012448DF0|nr:outer membrane beta-barrel domain-containing protein [Cellvibrio sp. KY-GH-1]QEY17048.1 outer membrane beta-barrel domain-containing protein [Cellvibrio sp. KY-GH-1]
METRFQRLFLIGLLASLIGFAGQAVAQEDDEQEDDELEQIITPDIKRRTIKEDDLDSEDFEMGAFFGLLSVEDFGTNDVQGITFAYHITEDFFVEAAYAVSKTEKTSYELLSGGVELLTEDQRDIQYYNLALGYNFLHGQVYISDKWAFNNHFYIMLGGGNTDFAAKDYFTTSIGAGLRFYATDWLALDLSMRGHSFEHELFGESKRVTNLESRLGLSLFF